jgi:hypothetical protein
MIAYTYLQPSLTSQPRISQAWLETEGDDEHQVVPARSKELEKKAGAQAKHPPPNRVSGVLVAASQAASLLHEAMKHNNNHDIIPGSPEDLKVRAGLYADILDFRESLPAKLRPESNFTPQTCLLR